MTKRKAVAIARDARTVYTQTEVMTYEQLEQRVCRMLGDDKGGIIDILKTPDCDHVIFDQAAFAVHLTMEEVWLLGAVIKLAGCYGKTVIVGGKAEQVGSDRDIVRVIIRDAG